MIIIMGGFKYLFKLTNLTNFVDSIFLYQTF